MINYNRNQFFILYDILNDILDECILIRDNIQKVKSKMTHRLFKIGKDYDLLNNNILCTKKQALSNRSKIIHIKKSNKAIQEELQSKGHIKIIFE